VKRLRIVYVDVPDTLVNIIRTRPRTELRGIHSHYLVPFICLQVPHAPGEETGSDEIEEAGRDNQEEL